MTPQRHPIAAAAAAAALALFGAFAPPQVFAQAAATPAMPALSAPAEEVQRVEVTGLRASLEASLAKKRSANSVVEVVTADDIGKLPDKNVADALQRVPGVNIASSAGGEGGFAENDRVSIRGTSPSLTQTLVNGHMISSGDWFVLDQEGGSLGRSVSYALMPSEILASAVVHKSATADLVEGGVAGAVDMITRRPLDFRKQLTVEATAQAIYSDLAAKTDPQGNALVAWKNESSTFGALLQVFDEVRHEVRIHAPPRHCDGPVIPVLETGGAIGVKRHARQRNLELNLAANCRYRSLHEFSAKPLGSEAITGRVDPCRRVHDDGVDAGPGAVDVASVSRRHRAARGADRRSASAVGLDAGTAEARFEELVKAALIGRPGQWQPGAAPRERAHTRCPEWSQGHLVRDARRA